MGSGRKSLRNGVLLLLDVLNRVGVLSGDVVIFVLYLMLLDPVPPLSTDCPEVIGLVNHSATVLVERKVLILTYKVCYRERGRQKSVDRLCICLANWRMGFFPYLTGICGRWWDFF